ncbi:hypothetical protein [Tritonibacter mobilis]|uniref:hypothetical protein n=1 Tax=Tritonibacter mobilis TaxID=379347 RepID=UPI000806A0D7|nr:hypothetical protein [Tritonibacter mobilis]NKX74565.1 hypothetical protein [Rhodobacteraceae bacterium R_SAG3]
MNFIYQTSLFDDGETTAPMIWSTIHNSANTQFNPQGSEPRITNGDALDAFDMKAMKKLVNFDAQKWQVFCENVGMTVYGAVALSWCKGAQIENVWSSWRASAFPLKPTPEFERPARFINPSLLPNTNSLAEIAEAGNNKSLPICAMIAALKGPLNFDLPYELLRTSPPQIASFLRSRMLRSDIRQVNDSSLIEIWSQTIKDTEYDVGEEEGSK